MDRDTKEPFCTWLRGPPAERRDGFGAMSHNRLTGFETELETLLKRFGAGQRAHSGSRVGLCIVATIVNLRQLERVYGSIFAMTARQVLRERARELCREYSGIVAMSGEHMLFAFDVLPHVRGALDTLPSRLLDIILIRLSERPVRYGQAVAFPVFEAGIAHFDDKPFDIASVNAASRIDAAARDEWREAFVADTRVAESVFGAMNDGRLDFDFERICDAKKPSATLYQEALLCKMGDAYRERTRIGSEICALERLGVVRCLDRWVVQTIIDRLRANPAARLGCNISTRSAVLDGWWALIVTTLAVEPNVASRLTIEITETFPLANLDATREFVAVLQSLGCRVALDDVGHDFGSLRNLITLDADIAKLDRSLIARCRHDEAAAARFAQLIELVKVCADSIVVEGIETESDAQTACSSGATGLQGYLYS
ncbi:EAL domain-containing protein [Paraburkholderia diazotrophica]|uniref:EAL domain, c-di-GMP-specific phosphodiesterase class I (Or its enzymatically inactive variant) n=1 Tax=Paraburkholderia diazotrophica TaxID=667676 RepID=A0A1H7CP64_9BURK|nr:EAL domain-containing protein [Paraburkholderia diazotrophica]SEJ91478.1 EAL domain, c-di-GMP-specific phosphodiesterase class I (or its enzymatically inactive variant) [Paraburkholderia diazotrophica]